MERQLAEFNRIYAKRVQLNVKIYQVEQNDSEDYQINWSTVINEAFGSVVNAPNAIASLGGTLSNSAFGINFKGLPKNLVQSADINLAKALVRSPDFLFLDEPTNHFRYGYARVA